MHRQPAVAGRFYPARPDALERDVARYCAGAAGESARAVAVIAPHAGFMFSGPTAGKVFGVVDVPETVIVLGPNHTGLGKPLAVDAASQWDMPMGPVYIDEPLVRDILARVPGFERDPLAHLHEHGIEAHVPFLQFRRADVKLVPVVIGTRLSTAACRHAGLALAQVVQDAGGPDRVLLSASTDMSHFLDAEETERRDALAVSAMEAFDPDGLHATVQEHEISMCGVIPTAIVLHAARALGADTVELLDYTHSGRVSGDDTRVVGYAGLVVR